MTKSHGNSDKSFLIIILILAVGLIGVFVLLSSSSKPTDVKADISNVVISEDGSQKITVKVDSYGYSPRNITAKAGIPTTLLMNAENAYGCQVAFTIPKLGVRETLPSNGDKTFDLGNQVAGSKIIGTCTMGMYSFTMNFN